jgi:hypothetical protein
MTTSSNLLAFHVFRGGHLSHVRGGTEVGLLLLGFGFAGLLVWAIERSRKRIA